MSKKKLKNKVRDLKGRLCVAQCISRMYKELADLWNPSNNTDGVKASSDVVAADTVSKEAVFGKWQPIESLPNIAGWVLVWSVEDDRVRDIWADDIKFIGFSCTHWMPLPEGPNEELLPLCRRDGNLAIEF